MTGAALPYSFDFNYDDGTPWLVGQWVTPGPNYIGTDPSDIRGRRGRITVGDPNDIGQFNARLWTDDSQDIDVSFLDELDAAFPRGTPVDTSPWDDIANPYPLRIPATNKVISGTSAGAALSPGQRAVLQALAQLRASQP